MPPTPTTTYRPPQRPAPAPAAGKKNTGLLIGLGVSAAIAVVGLIIAGLMWTGKTEAELKVLQHQDSAAALATSLGISLSADTNTPIDWNTAWAALDAGVTAQKKELADVKVQAATLEQQAADLQAANTQVMEAKTKSDQQVTALKKSAEELTAQKTAAEGKLAALTKEFDEAKNALAETQVELAAAKEAAAKAAAAPAPVMGGEVAAEGAAPAGEVAATQPAGEAPVEGAVEGEEGMEPLAPRARDGTHVFPEGTTRDIKKIGFDAEGGLLTVELADGNQIVYSGVPFELFDNLMNAPVPDTYFRLKLVGNFPSEPDDKQAMRALNKR